MQLSENMMGKGQFVSDNVESHRITVAPVDCSVHSDILKDKVILVIGGNGGIGQSIVQAALASGAGQVIVASRHAASSVCWDNARVACVDWDISNIGDITAKFMQLVNSYSVDCIVQAQGIKPEINYGNSILDISERDIDEAFSVNAKSVYFICQAACNYFLNANKRGHILNIASTEGLRGSDLPYALSKGFVIQLTRGLGRRFAQYGITINCIAPSVVATRMSGIAPDGDISSRSPSNRYTMPSEVANLAVFLLSDMASQMCGSVVTIDGGDTL